MRKLSTTIKQSKELLNIGVQPKSASLSFHRGELEYISYDECVDKYKDEVLPSFTLNDLINLLPQTITTDIDFYLLHITKDYVSYHSIDRIFINVFKSEDGDLIDAIVELLLKLNDNKKLNYEKIWKVKSIF